MKKPEIAFVALKLAFAAAVLTWLLRKVDVAGVWNGIAHANTLPILLGITFAWLPILITGWRWQRLLTVFNISIPMLPLMLVAQIGQFFLTFLPGTTGDDLIRMLYISQLVKGRGKDACTTVAIDRCIGLASVLALSVFCIPWQWKLLATTAQTRTMALAMLIFGSGIMLFGFFFAFSHRNPGRASGFMRIIPAQVLRSHLEASWDLLRANKIRLAQVIAGAFLNHIVICLVFYFSGLAVDIHLPALAWFSFVPIVSAASAIPVTIAGIGVREYLLVLFLGTLGHVESERALAASFLAFSVGLPVCLFGGVVYALYNPNRTPLQISKTLS